MLRNKPDSRSGVRISEMGNSDERGTKKRSEAMRRDS
jgi:hypothetical protein